jgi:RNA polymerase sigma factor, sigma-70 family
MESSQFKTLFLPCHRKLYAVAWRLTGNAQAAEDLVQETFLRLWTHRQQIVSIECVEAYSVTTLRRIFYDTKRSKQIEASEREISELHVKDSEDLNQRIDAKDEWQRIRTMILALPDPQGKIMIMRDVEGQTYEEISVETGLTEVNLRSILSRARKRIREQIKEMRQ